jgi:hypothetical protein
MVRYIAAFYFFAGLSLCAEAQLLEYETPKRLSENVNSEYEEGMVLQSQDSKLLFFTRFMHPQNIGGEYSGSDLWLSQYDVTTRDWGRADNKKFGFNGRDNTAVVGINKAGNTVYILKTSAHRNVNGIYFIKKVGDRWSEPELVSIPGISFDGFLGAHVSPDFDVIFLSMKGNDTRGSEDLYISQKNVAGGWSVPKNLGPTLNSGNSEISPFLSSDKKRLYFASNGHGGEGDFDIFYSDRLYDSWETWSAPKNLGNKINSKGFDAYFALYGDSLAYLASNRGEKYCDIYTSKARPNTTPVGPTKRFLSPEEIAQLMPAQVSRTITFEGSNRELSAAQTELLYYLVNKIKIRDDIKVELNIADDSWDMATTARIERITKELNLAGLSVGRITTITPKDSKVKAHKNVIELRFYRD